MAKISHVITGLSTGGAEMMLYKLLRAMDFHSFPSEVISLTDRGPVGEKMRSMGIEVTALGMRRGVPNPFGLWRLMRYIKKSRPDIVHCWMYHSNLLGGLAGRWAGKIPVIWGVRQTNLDPQYNKKMSLWTVRLGAFLSSSLPRRIVFNSEASCEVHSKWGYAAEKMVVIPNGFELDLFKPDPKGRLAVRQELGIAGKAFLIGLVGRFDAVKDHSTFLRAAGLAARRHEDVRFLLCGEKVTWQNKTLASVIDQEALRDRCHLLGTREDIPRVTAALDLATSSSAGEAFSNVIGEAMACGVPCVVTDVGDSALIVGNTGRVVPPHDPHALAEGWEYFIHLSKKQILAMGWAARARVKENYSLERIAARFENLYRVILSEAR